LGSVSVYQQKIDEMKISKPTPLSPRSKGSIAHTAETAQALAVRALVFLTREPDRIERFLALTGLDPSNLRQMAERPEFLLAVLDHMAEDEQLLLEFTAAEHEMPESIGLARRALSGPLEE
jgi:hypothetical protein